MILEAFYMIFYKIGKYQLIYHPIFSFFLSKLLRNYVYVMSELEVTPLISKAKKLISWQKIQIQLANGQNFNI